MSELSVTIQIVAAMGAVVWLAIMWDMWRNGGREYGEGDAEGPTLLAREPTAPLSTTNGPSHRMPSL